jgi:hypothetical protein
MKRANYLLAAKFSVSKENRNFGCAGSWVHAFFPQQTSRASACMRNSGGVFCPDVASGSGLERRRL